MLKEMIDRNTLAADYAKRCGWPNKEGFQVAHADDIAKAMLAFLREVEAAKLAALPNEKVELVARAICIAQGDSVKADFDGPMTFWKGWSEYEEAAEAVLAALPLEQEAEDIDVEIAIAEAIQLMPRDTAYEEKGVPVLQYLKWLGYRIVKDGSHD